MQTKTVDVHEAQVHLAELLSLMIAGTEIILTEGSIPLARIVPLGGTPTPRVAGLHLAAIWTSEDFDAPLPEEFWTGTPCTGSSSSVSQGGFFQRGDIADVKPAVPGWRMAVDALLGE